MKPEIFDNFLTPPQFRKISNIMLGQEFPWVFFPGKSNENEGTDQSIFQFVHMFYDNYSWTSRYSEMLNPIIETINPVALIRIKANLTTLTPIRKEYSFHRDMNLLLKSKTAVYYVNTNDGVTLFSTGEEVKSVANRLVIFDSDNLHTGTTATDINARVVINFNFFARST